MKKLIKILATLLAVVILFFISLSILVRILFPAEKVKDMILPKISESVGRDVSVDDIGFSVFPFLEITLENMEIANNPSHGFKQDRSFVHFNEFNIRLNWMGLFHKKLDISKIYLEDFTVLIEKGKDGSFNFSDMIDNQETKQRAVSSKPSHDKQISKKEKKKTPKPKKSPPKNQTPGEFEPIDFAFLLDNLTIKNAHIQYYDYQTMDSLFVGPVNQEIKLDFSGTENRVNTSGILSVSKIRYFSQNVPQDVNDFYLSLEHDIMVNTKTQKVTINKIRAKLQKFAIQLEGSIHDQGNPLPDMDIKISSNKIEFADLLKEIPSSLFPEKDKLKAQGFFETELTVKHDNSESPDAKLPEVKGLIRVVNGQAQLAGFEKKLDKMEMDLSFTEKNLHIEKILLLSGKDKINLTGKIEDFIHPKYDIQFEAKVLFDQLSQLYPLPEGMVIKGNLESEIRLKGEAPEEDLSQIDLAGFLNLNKFYFQSPELPHATEIDSKIDLTTAKISIEEFILKNGTSDLSVSGSIRDFISLATGNPERIKPINANFKITSNKLDMDEMFAIPETIEAIQKETEDSTLSGQASPMDNVHAGDTLIVIPELPPFNIKCQIRLNEIIVSNLRINDFNSQLSLTPSISKITTKAQIGRGSINHFLNLKIDEGVEIKTNLNAENMEANDFISALNDLLYIQPQQKKLFQSLRNTDSLLFGKLKTKMNFTTHGKSTPALSRNLKGSVYTEIFNGKISKNKFLESIFSATEKLDNILEKTGQKRLFPENELAFRQLETTTTIKDETVYFEKFETDTRAGNWKMDGYLEFEGGMDFNIFNRLPLGISKKITSQQDVITGKAGDLIGGEWGDKASSLLEDQGIPTDENGRVGILIGLTGTTDEPKAEWRGFQEKSGTSSRDNKASRKAKDKINREAEDTKEKARQEMEKKKEEARKKMEEAKKKAKDKLKDLFK